MTLLVARGRGSRLRRLASFLKSSATRRAMPPARASKLLFDPLEPRLMLNADLGINLATVDPSHATHDVVIRLVEETSTVATETVSQSRVEVVDQSQPSHVLASGALFDINQLSIVNGPGGDRVTIDLASFAGHQAPAISIAGSGATTLALNTDQTANWHLDGHGGGTVDAGGLQIAFSGIAQLAGGQGTDTIYGATTDTNWLVDGPGSGSV